MKCFIIFALVALSILCANANPTSKLEPVESVKKDLEKDAPRDKRSAILSTYAATAPIAYTAYSPYVQTYSPYINAYNPYTLRTYPSYLGSPYAAAYVFG